MPSRLFASEKACGEEECSRQAESPQNRIGIRVVVVIAVVKGDTNRVPWKSPAVCDGEDRVVEKKDFVAFTKVFHLSGKSVETRLQSRGTGIVSG